MNLDDGFGQKAIDDVLGDLLADDSDLTPKKAQASPLKRKPTPNGKDEDFYSAMAATAGEHEESDISEADVNQMAKSLADLDDLDADLFGGKYNKKKAGPGQTSRSTTPRQRTPRTPRSGSPPQKSGLARSSEPTPAFSKQSSQERLQSPPAPEAKPSTAPAKMTDMSRASENLRPGQTNTERPRTVPKAKPKYKFGDFDEDDPLAGLLSDEDEDLDDAKATASAGRAQQDQSEPPTQKSPVVSPRERTDGDDVPRGVQDRELLSPRRRRLMERPPTRSGGSAENLSSSADPLFEPVTGESGKQDDKPATILDVKPSPTPEVKSTPTAKPAKKKDDIIFSDDDDLLGGLDDEATPVKAKPIVKQTDDVENKPAKSALDSLLGTNSVSKHLDRPASGERKEFLLDKKYQKGAEDNKEGEDDFLFGSYMPSVAGSTAGSRPGSRRSVRFQDDDDIFGTDKPPSRGSGTGGRSEVKPSSPDLDWLEMASGGSAKKAAVTPEDQPSENNVSKNANSDWLGLKDSDQDDEYDWLKKPTNQTAQSKFQAQAQSSPREENPPAAIVPVSTARRTSLSKPVYDEDSYSFLHDITNSKPKPQIKAADDRPVLSSKPDQSTPKTQISQSPSDYLGLGKDVDLDTLQSITTDSTAFGTSLGPSRYQRPERRIDDLFSSPLPIQFSSEKSRRGEMTKDRTMGELSLADLPGPVSPGVNVLAQTDQPTPGYASYGTSSQIVPPIVLPSPMGQMTGIHMQQQLQHDLEKQKTLQQQMAMAQAQLQIQMQEQLKIKQQEEKMVLQQQQNQLEQMMSQLQQQYQANLSAQTMSSSSAVPSHGLLSSSTRKSLIHGPGYATMDNETKVRKLEIELECVQAMMEGNRGRYEDELNTIENSYKSRIQVLEESYQKREARWKGENEVMSMDHLSRLKQMEEDMRVITAQNSRRLSSLEQEKREELDKLRESHRKAISDLKREHEESLDRLNVVKNQEIDNITNVHSAAKSLQAVMQQVSSNAKDLGMLQLKVETWNRMGLDEREIFMRTKDEQLRLLQEHLEKQQDDNDKERIRLQDLIQRLEKQLSDQSRNLEEERWKVKQEQGRLSSLQNSLEEERRLWIDQQTREKLAIDKTKDSLLEEQSSILSQVYEERRALAEERNAMASIQRLVKEKEHESSIKYAKVDAEYDATMKAVGEEKARSEARQNQLERMEEHVQTELSRLDREKKTLVQEREKMAELALDLKHKSQEIDQMASTASEAHEEGHASLMEAQHIEADHVNKMTRIQSQLHALRVKEKEIAEERVVLSREKQEVEGLRNSMLCVNCRTPIRDGGLMPASLHVNAVTTPSGVPLSSPLRTDLLTVRPGIHVSANAVGAISASIEADRSIRMWKIHAEKDNEFLMEESMFLETLKHSPYHGSPVT